MPVAVVMSAAVMVAAGCMNSVFMGAPFGRELGNSHSGLSGAPAHCAVKPAVQLFQAWQIAQAIRKALVACDERVKAGDGCGVGSDECFLNHSSIGIFLPKKSFANAYESFAAIRNGY